MRNKDFKKILKEKEPKKIIYDYINEKIWLTNKQLDEVIKRKNVVNK